MLIEWLAYFHFIVKEFIYFVNFPMLGQVLSYDNIRDIIKFCKSEKLVLLADEVL